MLIPLICPILGIEISPSDPCLFIIILKWSWVFCSVLLVISLQTLGSESSLEVERTCFGQLVICSANFVNSDTSAGFFVISLLLESLAVPFWSVWSIHCHSRVLIWFLVILFSFSFALLCIGWSPFCAVGAVLLPVNSHFFYVHRMAQNEPEHTLPVFVQNNSLPAFEKRTSLQPKYAPMQKKQPGSTR